MAFDQSIAELDRIIAFVQSNVTTTSTSNTPQQQAPKKKQPQPKKEQKPAAPKKSANPDIAVFQNAHIQVVRIHSVAKHPQAGTFFFTIFFSRQKLHGELFANVHLYCCLIL